MSTHEYNYDSAEDEKAPLQPFDLHHAMGSASSSADNGARHMQSHDPSNPFKLQNDKKATWAELNRFWPCRPMIRWWLLAIGWVTMLALAFSLGSYTTKNNTRCKHEYDFSGYQCAPLGATPEVAEARGCQWDEFSFHWWPKDRYQDEDIVGLMNEFSQQEWHRYYEKEAIHEITEYHPMQTQAWVTRKEHLWHCAYTIMASHLWMTKGFDAPVTYWHTVHCTKALMNTILESPPPDFMDIVMHGSAWPTHEPVVCTLPSMR